MNLLNTVEDQRVIDRIDSLRKIRAKVNFLSLEPLIGNSSDLNLKDIDWVIVGGESGHKARPIQEEWVKDIQIQCNNANVSFFFKQWGGEKS